MRRFVATSTALFGVGLLYVLIGAATEAASLINGAGATFPFPLYSKWFVEYQKVAPDVQINYQSIGSGGGIRQFTENTVDFGATDAPMTAQQLSKSSQPVVHIPTVIGAAVLTYHLPGVPQGLKLTSGIIVDLFLGKIQKWNDPRIASINPSVSLPTEAVIIVRRSDGSGTTSIFTDYLSKVSPEWKQKVGMGTAVNWPVGLGGKGNEGVSGLVKQTPGAIGYVELIYAENNKLPYAAIQNQSGRFILPDLKSVTAAAQEGAQSMPDDFRVSITDSRNKNAYPMSAFTYLIIHQTMPKEKGENIVKFLQWAITSGQKYAEQLHFSPLPPSLVKKIEAKLKTIKFQ